MPAHQRNTFFSMIISVINQKGGVGKTTTAVNLAVSLAQWGHKTLLVDLDPQGNATSAIGISSLQSPTLYECLAANYEGEDAHEDVNDNKDESSLAHSTPAVVSGPVQDLFVLGASSDLAGAEVELSSNSRRDDLKRVLDNLLEEYPLIVIDTPPSLSIVTVNALVAADRLIIPVQCEYFALEGLGQLLRTLERIKRSHNPDLNILGLVRTMYTGRLGLNEQVSKELEKHFQSLLFSTLIPRNVRLAESPSHGLPIALYDRRSPGADAYRRLGIEVIKRLNLPKK
jgi:chromosome partitioning protein